MMEQKMEILITHEEILAKAKEIGAQITRDFKGEEIVLIGILRGSVPWMADIMKTIDLDMTMDYMACSSYGSEKFSSGQVKIVKDIDEDVSDKNVIIVEDIVDSGTTLLYLKDYFANKHAKSVKVCSLLNKPSGRKVDIEPDYCAFEVEDRFIVGYGLDFNQRYRQLPFISCLD
ncbi:MAG: hypoxanthine phosphoribosyltransferase [Anaerovoracaceae bacterium]